MNRIIGGPMAVQKKKPVVSKGRTRAKGGATKQEKKPVIAASIFWLHVKRIGFFRTAIGGFLMYVSVMEFIFIHLTSIIILYKFLLTPFFKVKKFRMRDYIIMDRGKIAGMRTFDRFNCEFCGYANGTATMWNAEIDEIAKSGLGKGKIFLKIIVAVYAVCLAIFSFFNFFFSKILFAIISLFLGYHWASTKESRMKLRKTNYAGGYNFLMKHLIRFAKVYAETLATNLEQIESNWCPLKHIESKGKVVPAHHRNFYDRKKLDKVIEVLRKDGSVSPRKPKY